MSDIKRRALLIPPRAAGRVAVSAANSRVGFRFVTHPHPDRHSASKTCVSALVASHPPPSGEGLGRRAFITLLAGATCAWPRLARAEQREGVRRIGVLLPAAAGEALFQTWLVAFLQGLEQLGWAVGHNIRIEMRWATSDAAEIRKHAAELVALAPDVILAHGGATVGPLLQLTRAIPIVTPAAGDPVASGFVESLARPGGNATGFMTFEPSMGGKWLELLKEIAPGVTRVAVLQDPALGKGMGALSAIAAAAPALKLAVEPLDLSDASEIERAVASFARAGRGGLVTAPPGATAGRHRELIVALAARYKLPAVYFSRAFVAAGGLVHYGADQTDQYRRAAGYVDRILKGEKPADLPVQAPVKYELAVNLKTAKTLGLDIPATVLARADEVIE